MPEAPSLLRPKSGYDEVTGTVRSLYTNTDDAKTYIINREKFKSVLGVRSKSRKLRSIYPSKHGYDVNAAPRLVGETVSDRYYRKWQGSRSGRTSFKSSRADTRGSTAGTSNAADQFYENKSTHATTSSHAAVSSWDSPSAQSTVVATLNYSPPSVEKVQTYRRPGRHVRFDAETPAV